MSIYASPSPCLASRMFVTSLSLELDPIFWTVGWIRVVALLCVVAK